jgi:hypothetical protein
MNLGWAVAWRATLAGAVLGAAGAALCVVAVAGLPGREPSQRAIAVLMGLVLLLLGVAALFAVRKLGLRMTVDDTGMSLRQRDFGFDLRWDELHALGLTSEKRSVGRDRTWFYALDLTLADPDDHPELDLWRDGRHHHYDLGRLGLAGRRLDRELTRVCPTYGGRSRTYV